MLSLQGVTWTHQCPIYFKTSGVQAFYCSVVSISFNWSVTIYLAYLSALYTKGDSDVPAWSVGVRILCTENTRTLFPR